MSNIVRLTFADDEILILNFAMSCGIVISTVGQDQREKPRLMRSARWPADGQPLHIDAPSRIFMPIR